MLQKQKQRNSVQDNSNDGGLQDPCHLDNSYLEAAIFSLWRMDILGFIKTKAILAKQFHIQPSEVDKMPYWEYEYFIKNLDEMAKKENEDQEEASKQYETKQKQFKTPKLPNIPKIPKM